MPRALSSRLRGTSAQRPALNPSNSLRPTRGRVAVDDRNDGNGKGPALPTYDNVMNGIYQPLSRPLFIYVNRKSAERPEVQKFIDFYMKNGKTLSKEVGYVALPDKAYELLLRRFEKRVTGSAFGGQGSQVGVKIEEL